MDPLQDTSSVKRAGCLADNESVQVVVRCRPMSGKEELSGCFNVVNVYPERGVIEVTNPKAKTENEKYKIFTYDGVYDTRFTQQNLYDEIVHPLVLSVLDGYNGCVFAYGQTGAGKTYTMEGTDKIDERGIIPRVFDQIWFHINRTQGVEFLVCVRYLEIYMEEIRDLLKNKKNKQLQLREVNGQGVVVSHLHSQTCKSADDMLKAMKIGNHNRTTASTNMNERSSRSHAIFQICIEMASIEKKTVKIGKLNLIDLAGSERQSKSGAVGDRLKEASKINKSLSALGNVIYALAENSSHIPYRDSKLTRLLQDSLGGNSKTIMIANVGPANMNYDETIITLRYAYRAKSIKNNPIKNEDIKSARLIELQQEIERLKQLIFEKSNGKIYDGVSESANSTDLDICSSDEDIDDSEHEKQAKEKEKQLKLSKMEIDELSKKLKVLESQMVHGGKSIIESVNENEIKLEQHKADIAARKKREIEMQQRIELEEESCLELKQVFANLQQEVEFKRGKLKRLYAKLQSLRQEIKDSHAEYLQERRELADANDEAAVQLQKKFLILDHFLPSEERSRLISLAQFDENTDDWILKKEKKFMSLKERPCIYQYRRPISDYCVGRNTVRCRGENILDLKLDMPLRTTQDYIQPRVCPQVRAAVQNVIQWDTNNNTITIKSMPHSFSLKGFSRTELENKFNQAARNTSTVYNSK